jgi:methionyl-tRNA formyltransferase
MKKSKRHLPSKPKLVFFGNERLATGVSTDAPTLRALVKAGYDIQAVVSSHTEAVSRNKRLLEIVDVAHAYHIPVLLPKKTKEIKDKLEKTGAKAAILVAYGQIIPQEVIDIFPEGIINIHPSLLPKLRGSTPVETAILNGLEQAGVSLMKLTAEMDAGPVYAQKAIPLSGQLLVDNLEEILSGQLKPKPQDETESTYTRLLSKEDGQIDFNEPADVIERKVRAFIEFPKTRAKIFNRDVIITKARIASGEKDGALVIKCQPGWLEIVELSAPSGRTMAGAEFVRGYRK